MFTTKHFIWIGICGSISVDVGEKYMENND